MGIVKPISLNGTGHPSPYYISAPIIRSSTMVDFVPKYEQTIDTWPLANF